MSDYSDKLDDIVAALLIRPDCEALAVAYRSKNVTTHDYPVRWEFVYLRCGTNFTMPENELVFQILPKEWVLAKFYAA